MEIPSGYAQSNLLFGGPALPHGAEMTLGWDISGYPNSPAQMAQDILTNLDATTVDAYMTIETEVIGCLVKFGPTATGPSAQVNQVIVGTSSGTTAAPNLTYLIRKHTAFGGRAGRGRMYMPGVDEDNVNEAGAINSSVVTGLATQWTAFLNACIADLFEPVLLHGSGSPISTPTPILSVTVDATAATQRRRMRR